MNEDIIREEEAIARERALQQEQLSYDILNKPICALPTLKPPITVERQSTAREAVEAMNRGGVGCVLVVDGGRLVGVFTERDVLTKVAAKGIDAAEVRMETLMTSDPECLTLNDSIAYALNKMSIGGFRHIPLIDEQGRPTGVVAMRNIVDYLVDLFPDKVLNLPPSPSLAIARTREGA